MNIVGTGLSGLVGSRVVELLKDKFTFTNLSLETGYDLTRPEIVKDSIGRSDAPWVFHFAAKTDVDGAELERPLAEKGPSWIVNVLVTKYIARACRETNKKMLYVSTDFVFDGTKNEYNEDDTPNPQGWYAITKYEGEKIVRETVDNHLIIRIANPYGIKSAVRKDFVHKIIERLESNQPVSAPSDQVFIPTFIDDIANALKKLITSDARGIYHVVGTGALSPYDVALKIAVRLGYDKELVGATSIAQFFKGRAPRPLHAVLKNDKITKLGVRMSTFDEGLDKIKLSRTGNKL